MLKNKRRGEVRARLLVLRSVAQKERGARLSSGDSPWGPPDPPHYNQLIKSQPEEGSSLAQREGIRKNRRTAHQSRVLKTSSLGGRTKSGLQDRTNVVNCGRKAAGKILDQ